jgi:cell division protein FtsW
MKREETLFTKPVNLYYMLLGSTLALSLLGLIMVFSASSIYSLGSRGTTYGVVIRQVLFRDYLFVNGKLSLVLAY